MRGGGKSRDVLKWMSIEDGKKYDSLMEILRLGKCVMSIDFVNIVHIFIPFFFFLLLFSFLQLLLYICSINIAIH